MAKWTVYRVSSLHNGGSGQSLERLGMVEADGYKAAVQAALEAFRMESNPALPQGGLTVVLARSTNTD